MRLSLASRPREVPSSAGIVHLGIGAFHRAHQAVYTEDAGDGWGICGITQRSAAVAELLAPQDGLYSVLERGPDGASARVIGAVREVLTGPSSAGADHGSGRTRGLADRDREGLPARPGDRAAAVDDPEIRRDLAGRPPQTWSAGWRAASPAARRR